MHITDYGLWFYCVDYGLFFDTPEDFIVHMQADPNFSTWMAKIINGPTDFLTLTCDIYYNGQEIDTSLPMKYMPKIDRITIQTPRAKKILNSECFSQISYHFKITQIQKKPNVLGQSLIMDYRPVIYEKNGLIETLVEVDLR